MSGETIDLFADALKDMANGPRVTDFQGLTKGLLQRLAEKGLTLEQCAGPKMLDRSVETLKGRCTKYGIRFRDFTPANMRRHVSFTFEPDEQGDIFRYIGPEATAIANVIGVSVSKKDGQDTCFFSAHFYEEGKKQLRKAGYEAKKARPAKKRKVKSHA